VHDEYVDPAELERAKELAARRALENTGTNSQKSALQPFHGVKLVAGGLFENFILKVVAS